MGNERKFHLTQDQIREEQIWIENSLKDPSLFDKLYNRYYERVLRFVYQRVINKQNAFDITSQVFLKAMINLHKFNFRGLPFSSWLFRIAINEINQLFRENKIERAVNINEASVAELASEFDLRIDEELFSMLNKALSGLQDFEIQIVEMRFFEKRSFKEIGEILNISENNAKVRLYRLLEKLKKAITANK